MESTAYPVKDSGPSFKMRLACDNKPYKNKTDSCEEYIFRKIT